MGVMRYIITLLDVLAPNIDIIMTYPDSLGLISQILKEALTAYLIYAGQECGNNEEEPFFDLCKEWVYESITVAYISTHKDLYCKLKHLVSEVDYLLM